jgi:hypothetical protein
LVKAIAALKHFPPSTPPRNLRTAAVAWSPEGSDTELLCNEGGAVLGVVNTAILKDLISLIPAIGRRGSLSINSSMTPLQWWDQHNHRSRSSLVGFSSIWFGCWP